MSRHSLVQTMSYRPRRSDVVLNLHSATTVGPDPYPAADVVLEPNSAIPAGPDPDPTADVIPEPDPADATWAPMC